MAEIILVYPSTGLDVVGVSVWPPLSLLHVASTIVEDFDVKIIDQRIDREWRKAIATSIGDGTICVGLSSMTGTQIKNGLIAAREVRSVNPDLPIVWGGIHPTIAPESTAADENVDIVVMGEGEKTFRSLVGRLKRKELYNDIANICYYDSNKNLVKNGSGTDPSQFLDRDSLPDLPYDLVDVEQYVNNTATIGRNLRSLPYMSSFGCAHDCFFCCQPILSRRRWRAQSPEIIAERIFSLVDRYKLDAIVFGDEEFFIDRKRGNRVAELINGKFSWFVQARMDDLLRLNLPYLNSTGLLAIQPGIETGSPKMLELINKKESVSDFIEANKRLAETDIDVTYNFMMGFPQETLEDLYMSIDLALRLTEENDKALIAGFYVYAPYPGSKLFSLAVSEGFSPPETLEGWSKLSRHNLESPWIKDIKDVYETVMMTSKFIDGKRFKNSFLGFPYGLLIDVLSKRYRSKWKTKQLNPGLVDGLILNLIRRYFQG